MKITKRQLRRIIRESLPYSQGQPWTDPKVPVGVVQTEDDLDRELTDEEIEAAMGMERADPSGDREFFLGYEDALDGKGLPVNASPDYKAGWEDGSLDRVTESIIREAWADAGVDLVQFIIDNIQAESNPTGAADWDTDELYEFLEKQGWTEEEIDFAVEDPRVGKYFDKLEGLYSAEQGTLEDYKQHPEWFN